MNGPLTGVRITPLKPAEDGEGGASLLREIGYDEAAITDILGDAE